MDHNQIYNTVMALGFCQIFFFRSISWEQIDGIQPSFAYDVDKTRFGLLCVNLSKFTTQLLPLVIVKISFQLNILSVMEITLHTNNHHENMPI